MAGLAGGRMKQRCWSFRLSPEPSIGGLYFSEPLALFGVAGQARDEMEGLRVLIGWKWGSRDPEASDRGACSALAGLVAAHDLPGDGRWTMDDGGCEQWEGSLKYEGNCSQKSRSRDLFGSCLMGKS